MSIASNAMLRAAFQAKLILTIRMIEDRLVEVGIAQSHTPPPPIPTLLSEAAFHLSEAQDELRRASAKIGQIEETRS